MDPMVPGLLLAAAVCSLIFAFTRDRREQVDKTMGIVAAVLCFLLVPVTMFFEGIHYSDGTRVGFVSKLSKKGLVYATWEGEMQMGGISPDAGGSVSSNAWAFSVRSDAVAKELLAAMHSGKRLEIHYVEYLARGCTLGSTSYDVIGVGP